MSDENITNLNLSELNCINNAKIKNFNHMSNLKKFKKKLVVIMKKMIKVLIV